MNKKQYSMAEIAKDLGISKSSVYRIITSNNIDPVKTEKRTRYYSESTYNFIKSNVSNTVSHDSVSNDYELIHELKEQIKDLKQERAQKNEQIEQLHTLLDQQQRLNLSVQEKLPSLETDNISDPISDDQTESNDPENKKMNSQKKHWWNPFH